MKRRQFLVLSSLGGLGLAVLGKIFQTQTAESTNVQPTKTANLAAQATTSTSADALKPAGGQPLLRFVSVADTGTGATGSLRFGHPSW